MSKYIVFEIKYLKSYYSPKVFVLLVILFTKKKTFPAQICLYILLFHFCFITTGNIETLRLIFVANNKNNWGTCNEAHDYTLRKVYLNTFQFSMDIRKGNKDSQFNKYDDGKEWVGFKSSFTAIRFFIVSLRYTYLVCIFHSQKIKSKNQSYFHILFTKPFEVPKSSVKIKDCIGNFHFFLISVMRSEGQVRSW